MKKTNNSNILNFTDTKKLFASKSTSELIFSWAILKFCSYNWLVNLSIKVFDVLSSVRLQAPLLFVTRYTFFKQFCSGETIASSKPALDKLAKNGVGTILEYLLFFLYLSS